MRVAAVVFSVLSPLALLAWGVGGQLSVPQIVKFVGFIPIALLAAVAYDYCYRNARVHLARCALLSFALALVMGTWGASLLEPWFTTSQVGFGVAAGVAMAVSFVMLGKWRLRREHDDV